MEDDDETNPSSISIVHYQTLSQESKTHPSEVEDLKYRISQLEHLVITSSLQNTTLSSSANPNSSRLTNHGLIERVSQLESLLAASELDNQRLNREIELLSASRHELKVDFLEKLREKDLVISDLEQSMELLQVKLSKTEQRLHTVGEYINTLPAQEELDEAKEIISRFETDNHLLQNKVDSMRLQLNDLQKEYLDKETAYHSAMTK
jgi:hypothetical protein